MTPELVFTRESERDLSEIADHIATDNLLAALAWLDDMRALCRLLARNPELGERRAMPEFGALRLHAKGSYVIYYRPTRDGVVIVRIVHGARESY